MTSQPVMSERRFFNGSYNPSLHTRNSNVHFSQNRMFLEATGDSPRIFCAQFFLDVATWDDAPEPTGSSMYCGKGESGKTLHGSEGVR